MLRLTRGRALAVIALAFAVIGIMLSSAQGRHASLRAG
jgi:hypothetical protein